MVGTLEKLLEEARDHKLIYIAFVAECHGRQYIINVAGETGDRTAIRRMVQLLDDKLANLTNGR